MKSSLLVDQIDGQQFKKILGYVKSGVDSGATLVTGGDRVGSRGFYIQPTVFADVEVTNVFRCTASHHTHTFSADQFCVRFVLAG